MNQDEMKEYFKLKLPDYLKDKGYSLRRKFHCLNPKHDDKNPSMSYDKEKYKVHCFSCGVSYDIFDLIGIEYNLKSFSEQFSKACEIFNVNEIKEAPILISTEVTKPEEDLTTYFAQCHKAINDTDYPKRRGLSNAVLDRFNVGFDPLLSVNVDGVQTTWKALIIPTGKGSYTARNTDIDAAKENRFRKYGASQIYNFDTLYESVKPVFVVESEIDALSIMEVGGEAVGLGGTTNVHSFLRLVGDRKPTCPLIISLDNDERGKAATDKLTEKLRELQIEFDVLNVSEPFKDSNDALINDRYAFSQTVKNVGMIDESLRDRDYEEYLKTSVKNHLGAFIDGIKESANTPPIPTGFAKLDKLLDDGLYEGLYIVGAMSSLGKTTFVTQIGDQIANNGTDVLIFSLEMSRYELMAKSISRLTLTEECGKSPITSKIKLSKTVRGILSGKRYVKYSNEDKNLISKAISAYEIYADRIFIMQGTGDIGIEQIKHEVYKHMKFTKRRPVVIIDYIQIMSPFNVYLNDKQNMDRNILELKRLSRDCRIPIIGISSFNRASYKDEEVSMQAFKESGAIEYSSDVLLALHIKKEGEGKDKPIIIKRFPQEMVLSIIKNRNGAKGDLNYEYFSYYNYFREM
jgi:replicative DNA helicase